MKMTLKWKRSAPKICWANIAVRYYPPSGDLYFGLMTRLGEMATFESVEAETKDVQGIRVRVATPAALHRLKRGTIRPIDQQDAAALRNHFDLGVERFRSIDEMNSAPVRNRATDGFERFIRLNARIRMLSSRSHPKGVFRFRDLEEAQRARQSSLSLSPLSTSRL